MKALLLEDVSRLALAELPTPEIGDDDVLVRVRACGICGSDVHGFDGSSGRRIPPLVMGHEAAGEVVEVGRRVNGLPPGTRVTFDSTVSCGNCRYCRAGRINLCDGREVLGVSCGSYRRHGAFAEFVAVPKNIVHALPDALSYEHAALVEAVSVAVHSVGRTPIRLGDAAVVVGSGMIGLLVIQSLRLAGCDPVFAVDLDDGKLDLAKQLGAAVGFNPKACDVASEVAKRTGGRGADVAMEVVGATEPLETAIRSLRKGGHLTLVGNLTPSVSVPLQEIVTREITLAGSCGSSGEIPRCIDLLRRGKIDVRPLISATIPLDDAPGWFDRLHRGEPGLMKVIVQP